MSAQLYVIHCATRRGVKVGYSKEARVRAKAIGRAAGSKAETLYLSPPCDCAPEAEALAHWRLRQWHSGGEWFDVEPAEARAVIDAAITDAASGERAPKRIGFASPLASRKTERVTVDIDRALATELDEWRAENRVWSRSQAVRCLVALGIEGHREP